MAKSTRTSVKKLGWGNQPRVELHPGGAFAAPGVTPPPATPTTKEELEAGGDGLYRMAAIIDDQTGNPFLEARVPLTRLKEALGWLEGLLKASSDNVPPDAEGEQEKQLRASAGVVVLSIAESQQGRTSRDAQALVRRAMEGYFKRLAAEHDPLLAEKMAINLDWVIPSLPAELATQARRIMESRLQLAPPYEAWFADGNTTLRIDWKCGSEFLAGWLRRLQESGYKLKTDGGGYGESVLTRTYTEQGFKTEAVMTIGPEASNVFRKMDDPEIHIVGYDGHSDWGRKIPRSLHRAPSQTGEKAVFYLLCCGKQILQKVRETYPRAHLVTTFNSSRFTYDFRYSEDFSAFINIMNGIARRESWDQIRTRVNKDWYNNPEKNYIFPAEPLAMARSLDRDHDGQADIFDKLIDFNTFDVETDALAEFSPRVPETPPARIVGTKLHFGVQVFHTLAHFNQVLEPFTHDLRVFSDGWYDPTTPAAAGVIERGPTRIRIEQRDGAPHYFFQGSSHFAHASEEAWRALASIALCVPVMATEAQFKKFAPEDRVLTGLLLVAHGLEVDDVLGRDDAVWRRLIPALELPIDLQLSDFQKAKKADEHWYAGSRVSLQDLKKALKPELIEALKAWALKGGAKAPA